MHWLRREPFRLFFPLALLLGWAGMLPWFLFGSGLSRTWPGSYHALTMTQAFLGALAVGFLGTMVPRRAQADPLTWIELAALAAALVAVPVALQLGAPAAAEIAYLLALATLIQFVVRAFLRRRDRRPAPPSFVLIPIGVAHGVLGAALICAYQLAGAPLWTVLLGRQLAQQGMMLALVLAVAPLLAALFARGEAPPDPPPGRALRLRALHAAGGLLLLASFAVELWLSARAGLLLRGALCAAVIAGAEGVRARQERPGLHRVLFRVALWLIPAGLLAAALGPNAQRIPLLHITFVGGFSLLAMAVSIHVTLLHTGRAELAERSPWPIAVAGALTLGAALVRACAERLPRFYFEVLTLASLLWLLAAVAWAAFLVPKLADRDA